MNHLKDATSPYLLQHANNPVDWYPWGDEALQRAKAEDKPILLSVGYSACHWCHVMAHESFEDPAIAALMNRDFICIKVDREERPDIDEIYMQATLIFNDGNGGWPMTVFLLPDGRPIHAGTYFPKEDRYGVPSFPRVMAAVITAFKTRREDVEDIARQVAAGLQTNRVAMMDDGDDQSELSKELLEAAFHNALANFDAVNGGLSKGRPKFPGAMILEFVLRQFVHNDWAQALNVVMFSLTKMARGGIYDQIGGGFHRYSVDEKWLVPHFEKMLYDNAQLSRLYLHTWQASGDELFKDIAVQIYDYILREMTAPNGGFYSTTDADSEGHEGKFFVWTPAEIRAVLTPREAEIAIAYWQVTDGGNFEGKNILHAPDDGYDRIANEKFGLDTDGFLQLLEQARQKLYAAREKRIHPARDEKILTAWNGMMLASLAEAARILGRDDYKQAAIRNADFLLGSMMREGRLLRSYKDGDVRFNGYLEDYANLIDGLIETYQTTYQPRYFAAAVELAEAALSHFAAPGGGFFDTSDDHEALVTRPRNLQDNATPSGNNMMAKVLVKLTAFTGDSRYDEAARGVLRPLLGAMQQYPGAFGEALNAADLLVHGIKEIAIIGEPADGATQSLLTVVNAGYRPNAILALSPEDVEGETTPALLAYRSKLDGKPAAYICEHFVCQRPVADPTALSQLLAESEQSDQGRVESRSA